MKLNIRHEYDCTPAQFWTMYWDDEFAAMLQEGSTVQRDIVDERTEGALSVQRIRFTPDQELPTAVASIIGSKKLVYEQENKYDAEKGILHWEVVPSFLPGKLTAAGTVRVEDLGDGRCAQIIDGDIKVNVSFIGGRIEKAVVAEVEKSWAKTAETGREYLRQRTA
ncbi:MAG: DUF2505 domain-containing protein [Myxococcota bacterium]